MENGKTFYCINCGQKTDTLYKKYSASVLKLTECQRCKQVADKYVEYDTIIIVIDLILLRMMAYRHILLNSDFRSFWKLSLLLILLESYSNWTFTKRFYSTEDFSNGNKTHAKPKLHEFDINFEDTKFFLTCINITLSTLLFIVVVFIFTKIYNVFYKSDTGPVSFILMCKTITLSTTGIFLLVPSIIWDITVYEYHLHFITLYTCLSQLLAYKVICNCPKIWSLIVIFSSLFLKSNFSVALSNALDYAGFDILMTK